MNFKAQLESDLHDVFLNTDEFGEEIEINGRRMKAVVEVCDVEFSPDSRPGVSVEGLTVYVAMSDAPDELRSGREVRFNRERWFVLDANCDEGLRAIHLYRELT